MKLEAKALCFSYDMSGMNEIGFPGNESKRTKRNRTTREILSRFDLTLESGELVEIGRASCRERVFWVV